MYPITDEKILRVLHRMEEEDAEDRRDLDKAKEIRMYTLHPDTSRLVHILIQAGGCKKIVEIGGAYGYSAIWLAHAARITGGNVTSLEINADLIKIGRKNLEETGLDDMVKTIQGDALETLPTLEDPLDFVLLDCWEWLYVDILKILAPKLRPGGIVVADNVNPGNSDSDEFIQALYDNPLVENVDVPIGREIEVFTRKLGT